MLESLHFLRVFNRRFPLALISIYQVFHLRFQLSTNAERIFNNHLLQVFNSALKFIKPSSGAFQAIGRADVENQKAIDILNQSFLINIRRQQNRVLRLNPAVTAHVQIPAILSSNNPKILTLSFRAFASAARDSRLELVRSDRKPR